MYTSFYSGTIEIRKYCNTIRPHNCSCVRTVLSSTYKAFRRTCYNIILQNRGPSEYPDPGRDRFLQRRDGTVFPFSATKTRLQARLSVNSCTNRSLNRSLNGIPIKTLGVALRVTLVHKGSAALSYYSRIIPAVARTTHKRRARILLCPT